MTQVSDVSRQYAVGSKQSAAAAAQLNTLSAELRASIAAVPAPTRADRRHRREASHDGLQESAPGSQITPGTHARPWVDGC